MITIIANIQYDLGLQARCANPDLVSFLAKFGIDFKLRPTDEGVAAIKTEPMVNVLIVDYHSKDCSEDIEQLCRKQHPEAKLVTINHKLVWCEPAERAQIEARYNYVRENFEGGPNWLVADSLVKFGLIDGKVADKIRFGFKST